MASILVLDCRSDIRFSLSLLLEQQEHKVLEASDPDSAKRLLAEQQVDLIILDMNFTPGTNSGREGLDFLGWLRESTASVPVVAFVPWSNAQLIEQALALGVCEFIDKPWRNIHLLHVVKRTLEMDSHRKAKTNPDPASNANLEKQTCNDSIPLMTLADAEKVLVKKAMAETDNHVPKAAVLLGLSKAAMYRRLEKHGISKN